MTLLWSASKTSDIGSRSLLAKMFSTIFLVVFALAGTVFADTEVTTVDMSDYPSVVYVATPYTMCFGALIKEQTVLTDARCLYPFSNSSSVPRDVRGLLKPSYLMVALPTVNTSATMHNILLSTQVYSKPDQAGFRATTFFGLVANYADNSTFFGVATSSAHAYYAQSQSTENAEQNFDVGIVTLKHPIKDRPLASLFIDDLQAGTADLTTLTFSPPNLSKDAATQSVLYNGIDLTKVRTTHADSLSRKECDSDYMAAYGLSNLKSFVGHPLPGNNPPAFCTSIYDNTTVCELDTSIAISNDKKKADINSVNLNSTLLFVPDGSSIKVISIGMPHLFEARSDPLPPCSSNGFIHFPRTGMYTDWIGWATAGSIAPNGTWINKPLTGDVIADFVDESGGKDSNSSGDKNTSDSAATAISCPTIGTVLAVAISTVVAIAVMGM
ncbi:hypothetical protein GGI07_004983 [Coemansia sp. Benny D115]|nr:hypothetical protein GGI07_004983 [Coemansia sp. Benny D115]